MYTESEYDYEAEKIGEEPLWELIIAALVFFILYCSVSVICKVRSLWKYL
jgi:hypothetical protein